MFSMQNVWQGSYVTMLGESLGILHIAFESLMRSLSNFMVSRIEEGAT